MKPELLPYANMPPCTAKELIAHANKVLRAMGLPDVQIRTLRFYIAQGVVPPPVGSPKFARYEFSHLNSLVILRMMQNQGMRLAEIKGQIEPGLILRERKRSYSSFGMSIDLSSRCRLELQDGENVEGDLRVAEAELKRILARIERNMTWTK